MCESLLRVFWTGFCFIGISIMFNFTIFPTLFIVFPYVWHIAACKYLSHMSFRKFITKSFQWCVTLFSPVVFLIKWTRCHDYLLRLSSPLMIICIFLNLVPFVMDVSGSVDNALVCDWLGICFWLSGTINFKATDRYNITFLHHMVSVNGSTENECI